MADMPVICLSRQGSLLELRDDSASPSALPAAKGPLFVLCPLRTLAVHGFDLPLTNLAQISEALRLRLQPFLAGGDLDLLPLVITKEAKRSRGVAWLVSKKERALHEAGLDGREARLVPAVLALAALGGEGALLADEENLYSVALRDGEPLAFRCQPRSRRDMEAEVSWLRQFLDNDEASIVTADLAEEGGRALADLREGAMRLMASTSPLAEIDLSGRAIDAALRVDRALTTARRLAYGAIISGLLAVAVAGANLWLLRSDLNEIQDRAVALYRETFGDEGDVRDPLSQARSRLVSAPGGAGAPDLALVLSYIGSAWKAEERLAGLTLETLRYNAFGADCVGAAPDVKDIEALQAQLKGQGLDSRIGDIQQTPGGRLRFSLSMRWDQP